MRLWSKIVISLWVVALFLQVGGQFGLFSGGKNAYTIYAEWDTLTHMVWAFAIGATILRFITLPEYLDKWRYWIPLIMFVVIVAWEGVELTITWLHLMPPEQMWTTPSNSFKDIVVGFLSTCTICFLWEVAVKFEVVTGKSDKVVVIPVVCANCRSKNLRMWRRLYDLGNYIVQCLDCNYAVEFRMLTSWLVYSKDLRDKSLMFGNTDLLMKKE